MMKTVAKLALLTFAVQASVLVLAGAMSAAHAENRAAAVAASASIGEVVCAEEDGTIVVTMTAGETAGSFYITMDGSTVDVGGDFADIGVPAGETTSYTITGIEDGEHTIAVDSETPDDYTTIATAERTVACDVAPVGPYTNAKGSVNEGCEDMVYVTATNKPIAGNVADLQPVTFTVTVTHEGAEPTVVDTFVLDAENPEHEGVLGPDLGGKGTTVTLLGDGEPIDSLTFITECLAVDDVAGPGPQELQNTGTAVLPNTGLSDRQAWLAALAMTLIIGGVVVMRTAERD